MHIHQAPTDQIKKTELPSTIQQVLWTKQIAAAGGKVGLEIFTNYVGNNSELKIKLSDKSGKNHGKFKDKISGNKFWTQIAVPINAKEELYAEVKLPKHGLKMKSNPLIVLPQIKIENIKWDKKEARRGDILKLTADIKSVPDGTEAEIEIWEYDADEAHDLITKFPVVVKNKKVEVKWEYEYHEDTDDIPTDEETEKGYNPPKYFFKVKVYGVEGKSELLQFKDWIEVSLKNQISQPIPFEEYILTLPDGKQRRGKVDENGKTIEKDIPPGICKIDFPNL